MTTNRLVLFITTETGDDLILSFALRDVEDPSAVQSLTLLRTPKYEFILEEPERGVHVGLEGADEDADDYLESFDYDQARKLVRLKTTLAEYELDVRKVDEKELTQMMQVIRNMNFDSRFTLSDV